MPVQTIEITSYHAMLGCVVVGMGISLVPLSVLATFPERARLSVHALPPGSDCAQTDLIWRKGAMSPKIRALVQVLKPSAPGQSRPMRTRFILINTSHAGNVGATARAMKTMGFDGPGAGRAALGQCAEPRRNHPAGQRRARRAQKRPHRRHAGRGAGRHGPPVRHRHDAARLRPAHARAASSTLRVCWGEAGRSRALPAAPESVAFLFGSERFGMQNEDVYRCHVALSIPTDPKFGSLNLGAAVQLIAYDWRQALGGFSVQPATAEPAQADAAAGGRHAQTLGRGAGRHRLSGPGLAQKTDAAAQPAVQPCPAEPRGNPHPARRGQGHAAKGSPNHPDAA